MFKIGFNADDGNPYNNKIVAMDEGHHLTTWTSDALHRVLVSYVLAGLDKTNVHLKGRFEQDDASSVFENIIESEPFLKHYLATDIEWSFDGENDERALRAGLGRCRGSFWGP